ncbi:MAG: hypothetical protein ABJN04_11175 [Hyphomicrobiales bacterium]
MTNEPKQPGVTPGSQNVDLTSLEDIFPNALVDIEYLEKFGLANDTYASYPIENAARELINNGFVTQQYDVMVLYFVLLCAEADSKSHVTKSDLKREYEISDLCAKLIASLQEGNEVARETYYFDGEREKVELDLCLSVESTIQEITYLQETAKYRIEAHTQELKSKTRLRARHEFQSRHYFWLGLLAYWAFHLKREVGSSTRTDKTDAYGPLIRFINIMSCGQYPHLTGHSVREWIRDHEEKLAFLKERTTTYSEIFPHTLNI